MKTVLNNRIAVLRAVLALPVSLVLVAGCSEKSEQATGPESGYEESLAILDLPSSDEPVPVPVDVPDFSDIPNSQSVPSNTPGQDTGQRKYVGTDNLNVRTGPGLEHPSAGKLSHSLEVKVLGDTKDSSGREWYRIEYQDSNAQLGGWVAASYVVNSRQDLIYGNYAHLNYDPLPKPEFASNPRRDAKGVYVTLYTAASERMQELIDLAKNTEINALVIDVKDDRGHMLYQSKVAAELNPNANNATPFRDASGLVERLKAAGIYAIARVVTFKDPTYAEAHPQRAIIDNKTGKLFHSTDGLLWASPHDRDFQDYNIAIAKEAAELGFNEIQFDYVRFPVESRDSDINYRNYTSDSKPKVIQDFLLRAREQLHPLEVYISADVFGLAASARDDVNIGQYWEAVSNAVDYISPMTYPSHYADGFYGLNVPDKYPYKLMDMVTKDALRRSQNIETPAKIRPWIQGFTATWVPGYITYGPTEIRAQIQALEDNGVHSYLVWKPNSRYDEVAFR